MATSSAPTWLENKQKLAGVKDKKRTSKSELFFSESWLIRESKLLTSNGRWRGGLKEVRLWSWTTPGSPRSSEELFVSEEPFYSRENLLMLLFAFQENQSSLMDRPLASSPSHINQLLLSGRPTGAAAGRWWEVKEPAEIVPITAGRARGIRHREHPLFREILADSERRRQSEETCSACRLFRDGDVWWL